MGRDLKSGERCKSSSKARETTEVSSNGRGPASSVRLERGKCPGEAGLWVSCTWKHAG